MPCTVHSFTGEVNEWGEPGATVTASTETVCWLEQTDAFEALDGQETYWVDGRIFLPAGTDIGASAWVEVEGAMYEVVGKPATHTRPNLTVSHMTANVREVTSS